MSEDVRAQAWQFNGRWIGESQGVDRPAHIWEIRQVGDYVEIDNMWEGDPSFRPMSAHLVEGEAAFDLSEVHRAVMVDPQHFIIAGWDMLYDGEELIAEHDVVFSRPGIAELTAHQVWTEWKKRQSPNLDK
jgi:hypothetical protein